MSRWTLVAGWLLVLVAATTVTWQIVSAADDRVSERPLSPLNVAAPQLVIDTTNPSTTAAVSTTGTLTEPTPTTTEPDANASSTVVTSAPTTSVSTPATSAPSQWESRTVQTKGGSVVLSYHPGEVILQAAAPAPGYQAEVEKKGPPKVHVEFESEAFKVELQAEWRDGDLAIDISEESHD